MSRVSEHIRERQNEVFSEQVRLCGLLAAAFYRKHGGVRMRFINSADGGTCFHEAEHAPPVPAAEPLVWKQRAEEYYRATDIPPDECMVVTRYAPDGSGRVGFERKRLGEPTSDR